MAMMPCPECKKEISSKASFCPNCGHPIVADTPKEVPTTIQQTKKKWKGVQAIAFLFFGLALFSLFTKVLDASMTFFLIGLAVWTVGQVGAWWSTG